MSEFVDPYLDPATGVLRNLIGARTQEALDRAEGDLSMTRLVELGERYPVRPTGDMAELRGIHRHLFHDLYGWAGEIRTVDLRKPGGEPFLPVSRIGIGTGFVFDELQRDRQLKGLGRSVFVERLAYHYDALNYAHPFREGNGRAQRVFWSRVAADAGWPLDWRLVSAERNNDASRVAMERSDLRPLQEMFDRITSQASPGGGTEAGQAVEAARRAVDVARLGFARPATQATTTRPEPGSGPRPRQAPDPTPDRTPEIGD